MSLKLFREEAIEHQRAKLWGDVIIIQPTSYYFIAALFLALFVMAGFFLASQSYTRKETVAGFLSPEGGMANIYADRGGVVAALHVAPGDHVEKGQPLAELRLERRLPTGETSQEEYEASLNRELADVDNRLAEVRNKFEHDLDATRAQLASQKSELAGLKTESALVKERIALATEQHKAAQELADKGYAAQRLVDQRLEALLQLRQLDAATDRQIASVKGNVQNTISLIDTDLPYRLQEEESQLRQRRETLRRELSNVALNGGYILGAPTSGYVTSVLASEGATAAPNAPLVVIRPENSALIAKLLVPSRAAGLIREGQEAKIQYDAFPYQRFGVFSGKVTQISQSVVTPGEMAVPLTMHEAFYVVELALDGQSIHAAGQDILLKPGMLLKADIKLEERTLVEWIFDPILAIKGKL